MKLTRASMLLLLTITLAISASSASPAAATVWKDKGVNVTKFFEIQLTGFESVLLEVGTPGLYSCEIKATLTSSGGSSAKITKWETRTCTTLGSLEKCKVTSTKLGFMPWSVNATASDLEIEHSSIERTFSGCAVTKDILNPGIWTATLNTPTAISKIEITASNRSTTLSVDAPNAGTYGIG